MSTRESQGTVRADMVHLVEGSQVPVLQIADVPAGGSGPALTGAS